MKAVLISIQPKWCELIASGKKTVEVRKTKPNFETPFKVYIYCAANKQGVNDLLEIHSTDGKFRKANSKVIGEFVCDRIRCEKEVADGLVDIVFEINSCINARDLLKYANGNVLYSWHISDLEIYDKPKELREFYNRCYKGCDNCEYQSWDYSYAGGKDLICTVRNEKPLKKPPQSWCYVESLGEG